MSDSEDQNKISKLWGGRFGEATNEFVQRFSASVSFDQRLYKYDIEGSIAHAKTVSYTHLTLPTKA